jgi:hypothetical protein
MAENYVNRHPFGMDPTEEQIAEAVAEARKVYEGIYDLGYSCPKSVSRNQDSNWQTRGDVHDGR